MRSRSLRKLRALRARQGRGYHEIIRRRRSTQIKRGRFKQTCLRLTYQIPLTVLATFGIVAILMQTGDRRISTPEEIVAAGFGYNLTSFEVRHLPAKWVHRIHSALPWTRIDVDERQKDLNIYRELARELRFMKAKLENAMAHNNSTETLTAQSRLETLLQERNAIRDSVEELLEAAISTQLIKLGLHQYGEFVWPPVDFRIDDTPHVLVTSPRNVIQRASVRILQPRLAEHDKSRMETELLERANLSAIVLKTGGLASYPNLVPSDYDLLPLLEVSAHEWLHAYLIFHPLGRAYWSNSDMTSLNETLANLFGKEIGRTVYNQLTGDRVEPLEPPYIPQEDDYSSNEEEFEARTFLHETRHEAERLLKQGKIEEAEEYMEQRRQILVENGHNIRKINQAFFAFHGTYADSPSSTSPLARQIWELRQQSANSGQMVKTLQTISNYEDFLKLLDAHGIER